MMTMMRTLAPPLLTWLVALVLLTTGLVRAARLGPVHRPLGNTPQERAFQKVCSTCHNPFSPRAQSKQAWPHYVTQMMQRAENRGIEFTDEELTRGSFEIGEDSGEGEEAPRVPLFVDESEQAEPAKPEAEAGTGAETAGDG